MFDPVDPKQSLPELEKGILRYWQEEDIFKRSIKQREDCGSFGFYDGPPFATGLPHYGHLLAGTIKDVIPRYQTMQGKKVERRFGWDCHGLPIENLIEKEHDIKDKQQIEEMGVGAFNDLCRSSVQRYATEWREVVERMGRWVDMDWDYKTMNPDYMESIWWVVSELTKRDLIYEGYKSMHVCPRCVTPLSNFEVTQGYQDITDHSVTVMFKLTDEDNAFVLAWTTTPWTLPGNLFLAVGKNVSYALVESDGQKFILAEDLVEAVFGDREHTISKTMKGEELLGKKYSPLFSYFADEYGDTAFRIVEGEFVTTDEGTGIVHIAPGFGEDDFRVGEREGAALLQHVTMEGLFVDTVTDFAGEPVKPKDDPSKTDQKISQWLQEHGHLFKTEKYKHSYPHCWRCDSPLLNYTTNSWFVSIDKIKDDMLKANSRTEWVPAHIRDGRFGKWLENARDWAISRSRYWGTPIPIWRTPSGEMDIIGSRDALMAHAPMRFTKVTALRHAESIGNTIPIYQGKVPGTDLTKQGKKQAREAAKALRSEKVDVIYCSPLARTKQTAEAIAKKTGAAVIVDERLREVSFGEYEGKTIDFSDLAFVKARRAHKMDHGKAESIYHFEGMETWKSVQQRIADFMEEILPRHRSEHVVVVTHADPMQNIRHFFTQEDQIKISHQPYPNLAHPQSFYWDHDHSTQMDLHMDKIDDVTWPGPQTEQSVAVTLVRHGETDWNKKHMCQGSDTDNPMNETGRKQIADLAEELKGEKYDVIVTSDLKRAIETTEILSKTLDIPNVQKWPTLRERLIGDWSGKERKEIFADFPPTFDEMKSPFLHHATPPNGESLADYLKRIREAAEKLQEEFAGKRVIVVSHGGTTRALHCVLNGLPHRDGACFNPERGKTYQYTINPPYRRIPEVLDCWFESGSMPYAQEHFPFEMEHNGAKEPLAFPADFIAENLDQTRGWFYTLTVLGTALFGKSPFEHCICGGMILAEDGKKMSKRLKNYPDPTDIMDRYGADALRFTLMSSPVVRAQEIRFSEKPVEETMRSVLLPLLNTYSFFVTYANAAGFEPTGTRRHSTHPLDRWMRAEVQDLVNRMTKELDGYDLSATCSELHDTIDALTNWYVRLSRRRFAGKSEGVSASEKAHIDSAKDDQMDALNTLYDVLLTLSQVLCPFCPYLTDAIYLNLVAEEHGSIHLTDWPGTRDLSDEEQALLTKTRFMRKVVSLGHTVRSAATVKVRQPLSKAIVAAAPATMQGIDLTNDDLRLLRQEMNVKDIEFVSDPGSLADVIVQVDARKVGPRLGKRVQEIIQAGKQGDFMQNDDGSITILDETFTPEEANLTYRGKEGQDVAADRGVVVSVDTNVTDELKREGLARDLIRTVQRLRKEAGLSFTDTINLSVEGADDLLQEHTDLITQETRSVIEVNNGEKHEVDLDGMKVTVQFAKIDQ